MKKTFPIIMLPTRDSSSMAIICNKLYHVSDEEGNPYEHKEFEKEYLDKDNHTLPQCLYILSDDAIRKNDWAFDPMHNNFFNAISDDIPPFLERRCKKVIATINGSLKIKKFKSGVFKDLKYDLPQIPQSFLHTYIKAHNAGKTITEIDLEVEECIGDGMGGCCAHGTCIFLKKDDLNNVIVL
jgi:hypothetical protein